MGINSGASWSFTNEDGRYGTNMDGTGGTRPSTGDSYYMQGGNSASLGSGNVGRLVSFNAGAQLSMDGVFDFLKEKGTTNVVSNPKVLTLNNQQALITVGDTINYQTRSTTVTSNAGSTTSEDITNYSLFVGILLNILPTVSDNGDIMLRINPSLSDFKYRADDMRYARPDGTAIPREIAPDTTDKKLSTVVNVKSGDTIVLGGLITNSIAHTDRGVPLLSSIPLLGYAFKYAGEETKTKELVFIITPRVIGEDTTAISSSSLKDLGYSILEK
jgi:general secretion pathway protein D